MTTGWADVRFDLAAHTGREARVRFTFGSDGSTAYEGWYLDDIHVAPATGPAPLLSLDATSGVVATRFSPTWISLGMPILMFLVSPKG